MKLQGLQYYFPVKIYFIPLSITSLNPKLLGFLSYKNSLTWGVKSEKLKPYPSQRYIPIWPIIIWQYPPHPSPPPPEYHTHRLHVTNFYTLFSGTYGQIRDCELILRMCYFFRKCLGDCNIECWLQCISSFSDCVSVTKFVHAHDFRCVIGIHAWRAGRLLLGLRKFKLIYIFLTIKGIGTSFWFVWVDQNWL